VKQKSIRPCNYQEGQRVLSNWQGKGRWYWATVDSISYSDNYDVAFDTYDLAYDDGDSESDVPCERVAPESAAGRRLLDIVE